MTMYIYEHNDRKLTDDSKLFIRCQVNGIVHDALIQGVF